MKTRINAIAFLLLTYVVLCGFHNGNKRPNTASRCKDGSIEMWGTADPVNHLYIEGATEKRFILGKDTLMLPCCYGFAGKFIWPDNAHLFIKDTNTGGLRCYYKIIHLPDTIPFFLRKELTIHLSLSAKQQQHFDAFKKKVLQVVKDTTLGPALWYSLSSIESSLKNSDAISYAVGLRQLTEAWAKIQPAQFYGK